MAIDILNALTNEELDLITKYRRSYAAYGDSDDRYDTEYYNDSERFASNEHVLRKWAINKERIYHLFGDKLIISKDFVYEKSNTELTNNMRKVLRYGENIAGIRNVEIIDKASSFYSNIKKLIRELKDYEVITYAMSLCLTDEEYLVTNSYIGSSKVIQLKDNETYKLQTGAKLTKIFAKLAQVFNIEGFEEFRLVHSQVLNQKKVKGTMCLSIHPLDYMTMSDNDCGWSSCMSWTSYGCYRQGTVEMMNSDCVVVAYIKSNENYYPIGSCIGWSDKKWRQLIVFSDEIISGIKSYPYYNESITCKALDFLAELCENGYYNTKAVSVERDGGQNYLELEYADGSTHIFDSRIYFYTNQMYNDVTDGGEYSGFAYISRDAARRNDNIEVTYSGETECMWCGDIDEYIEHSSLVCNNCYSAEDGYEYCACCGCRVYESEQYTVDGRIYCEDCYYDETYETVNDSYHRHNEDNIFEVVIRNANGELRYLFNPNTDYNAHFYQGIRGAKFRNLMRKYFKNFYGYVYNGEVRDVQRVTPTYDFYGNYVIIDESAENLQAFIEEYGLKFEHSGGVPKPYQSYYSLAKFEIGEDGETITQV